MQYLLQTKSENLLKACHARAAMSASVNYTLGRWESHYINGSLRAWVTGAQRWKIMWRQSRQRPVQPGEPATDGGLGFFPRKIKGHLSDFGLLSRKLNELFCLVTNYLQIDLSKSNNPVRGTNKTAGATEKHTSACKGRELEERRQLSVSKKTRRLHPEKVVVSC